MHVTQFSKHDEECLICKCEFHTNATDNNTGDSEDIFNLPCGHSYHYSCLYYWYKSQLKNGRIVSRKCLLCYKEHPFLPLKKNYNRTKYIHFDDRDYLNDYGNGFINYCSAIIKSKNSTRFGQQCNQFCGNQKYCTKHINCMNR